MVKMSDKGIKLLKEWEGFKRTPYNDIANNPTVGVGHLLTKQELMCNGVIINTEHGNKVISIDLPLSDQSIETLLRQDLEKAERAVDVVSIGLNQNQIDSLISFAFNIGVAAFKSSTLFKRLKSRDFQDIPNQLKRWVHSGGKISKGLVNRRNNEIKLWLEKV